MVSHGIASEQEMMLKEQLDGVVIAVPTHMHLAIAEVPWRSSSVKYFECLFIYVYSCVVLITIEVHLMLLPV